MTFSLGHLLEAMKHFENPSNGVYCVSPALEFLLESNTEQKKLMTLYIIRLIYEIRKLRNVCILDFMVIINYLYRLTFRRQQCNTAYIQGRIMSYIYSRNI